MSIRFHILGGLNGIYRSLLRHEPNRFRVMFCLRHASFSDCFCVSVSAEGYREFASCAYVIDGGGEASCQSVDVLVGRLKVNPCLPGLSFFFYAIVKVSVGGTMNYVWYLAEECHYEPISK